MSSRIFGSAIKRREDPRLITGAAKYVDDFVLPGMAHMAVVRSPYAHARIKSIDGSKALAVPGVVAVYTGQQMKDAGFGPIPCAWAVPNANIKMPPYEPIAIDTVRYVGNAVAVVIAESRYAARDGVDAVEVDYEPLATVVDAFKTTQPGAPQLHAEVPENICFKWTVAGGDAEAAFKVADVVVKERIINQRLIPTAMEPRACLAQYSPAMNEVTLWASSQNPHIARFLLSLDTGIPEHQIRVIAPEIGGGFGSKIPHYPEDSMVIFASKMTNRPVKWTETRAENYKSTIHGRDHIEDVEMCATREGIITGLRATTWANLGAYLSTAAPGVPTILHGLMLSGVYNIPNIHEDVYGVFTNTTPVDAYRGAGRPEATFLVERLVDLMAMKLKVDPAELRKRNFIAPFSDGHAVATGLSYDTRQLHRRLREGARDGRLPGAAQAAGRPAARRQDHGHRHLHLRRDLRARAVAGGGRRRLRRRALGERHRALPSVRQGARHDRHQAAWPGRGNDVRTDRRERAGRFHRRRHGLCSATPRRRRRAGAPTAAAPPRLAAARLRTR